MREAVALLLFLSVPSGLVAQRDAASQNREALLASVKTGGHFNGNWWVLVPQRDRIFWLDGFGDGLAVQSAAGRCEMGWVPETTSVGAMVAQMDAFYAEKQNRRVPLYIAFTLFAKRSTFTEAEYTAEVLRLRKAYP